ncbi:MAG TPA: phasin family protein [Burkholderiales bacterium]|jgi:phasin family protein|nr:phasin family protein [Burkholderiales bacterium]
MTTVPEQISAFGKAQVDTALRFATIAAENTEKLFDLQIKNSKAAFNEGMKNAKALAEVKDFSDLPIWTSSMFQPGIDKATAYARSLYEVAAGTQSEISAVLEAQVAHFSKDVVVALDAALKSAPPGSEPAVAAVKSVVGTANSVYESITKASKQLAAMTEANLTAAASQAGVATRKKAA